MQYTFENRDYIEQKIILVMTLDRKKKTERIWTWYLMKSTSTFLIMKIPHMKQWKLVINGTGNKENFKKFTKSAWQKVQEML